jgi:sulfate adenylyltransferase subunit 2
VLHAVKAFYPSPPPFPLLHVDTPGSSRRCTSFRERAAREHGMELIVHQNPEAIEKNINPIDHGSLHTDMWKTEG